ncbi:MAG TPA: hypothetical protein VG755_13590 [Nannocystaceae bacterium]|nr:hypothetical protein [Nannocystaceae bacterium]
MTACSNGNQPTADLDSARSGWRSTEVALASAGIHTGWSGSATVGEDGVQGVVMGAVDCPDGGSLNVEAEAEVTEGRTEGELSITFDGCNADGVTIDGAITYAALVDTTDGTDVTAEVHGELEWSGDAEGTCAVDISAHVTSDGASATSSVSGGLCGHGWTDVFAH